jgi:3-oxoacyl-[acyl-carrier-protein] synthase II
MKEVVVTGVGVMSAAGGSFAALRLALEQGHSCGTPHDTPLPVGWVGEVQTPVTELPSFRDDRKAWLAMAALEEALADAGGTGTGTVSVFLGTGLSSVTPSELEEDAYPHLRADGLSFDRAALLADLSKTRAAPARHDPARVTSAVARRVGATGPCGTSFSACSAAAQAIVEGLRTLRRGEADVAIVGGHDSMIHPFGMLSFVVLGALSPSACRPFDRQRDGFMIGEGAAMLVLECAEHARARGAHVRARLLGAGTSVDGHAATAPQPEGRGAAAAMRAALKDAGILGSQVDYVNAHATGTPVGDIAEAAAIRAVTPAAQVSSIKGAIGHTIAAAGAIEAAACIAALEGGFMPGTVGLRDPDPEINLRLLMGAANIGPRIAVSNSFGFGGQNAALVFGHAGGARG